MSKLNDDQFAKTPKAEPLLVQLGRKDADLLAWCLAHLGEAMKRVGDSQPGQTSGTPLDTPGGGSGEPSSPVERAIGDDGRLIDNTRGDKLVLTQAMRHIHLGVEGLARFVQANSPRPADKRAKKLAELAAPEFRACEHCTPHRAPGNAEEVYRVGDVGGRLPQGMALGRFCYEIVKRTGEKGQPRLPFKKEIERHDAGQQVRLPA